MKPACRVRHTVPALALALVAAGLPGCATAPPAERSASTVVVYPPDHSEWERNAREQADELIDRANLAMESDRPGEALGCVDQALEIVLSPPPGYAVRPAYLDYIAELLQDADAIEAQLDDTGADDLFIPSEDFLDLLAEIPEEEGPPGTRVGPGELPPSDFPLVLNSHVERFLEAFTSTGEYRSRIERGLERSARYLPMIRERFRSAGLPEDLSYLPLIESAFSPTAYSRARAAGMWQFIASTGRLYGLKVSSLLDERRDPERSTDAAVAHLADLHAQFGDWYLALAAYNSGAGNVRRAIRRSGSRDFWKLRRYLPRETRNYVPAFIASVIVARNPELYGLDVPEEQDWEFDTIEVPDALDLQFLATKIDVPLEELRKLNPAIRRDLTPARHTTMVRLPAGTAEHAQAVLQSTPRSDWAPRVLHSVRRGESLYAIARRYGTSVGAIRQANGIRGNLIRPGQTLVVPRKAGMAWSAPARKASVRHARGGTYTVRRGDTVWDIARSFGVPVSRLRAANGLSRRAVIRPGQKLVIPSGSSRTRVSATAKSSTRRTGASGTYTVRHGDTVWDIARAHGIPVSRLRAANSLSRRAVIHPGQKLVIPGGNGRTASVHPIGSSSRLEGGTYTVRRGDTLFNIARKFGITVGDLRRANGIRGSRIHPGEVLTIPSGRAKG